MPDSIEKVAVLSPNGEDAFKTRWGTTINDYKLNGVITDLQDLLIVISEHRANAVEAEVNPLSTRMRQRNTQLEKLGNALADLTKAQSAYDSDHEGDQDMHGWLTFETGALLEGFCAELGIGFKIGDFSDDDDDERPDFYKTNGKGYSGKKKCIDAFTEKVKKEIDNLNNKSQTDMTRLQSLVDRRDESYSVASDLMTQVSDTRANAIRNM